MLGTHPYSMWEKKVSIMLPVPKVLLFVCDAKEKAVLQQTLAQHAELTWVSTPQEMTQQLARASFDVVVSARNCCMMSWKEVLEEVRQLNASLPVIILSQTAQPEEWEEVLAAGAFDLLGIPCYDREPLFLVEHAAVSYEARLRQNHGLFQAAS
jgi:DNA-binding NtrC family response regulator